MDFDETRLYYSHQQLQRQRNNNHSNNHGDGDDPEDGKEDFHDDDDDVDMNAVRRHFREFLRTWWKIYIE